MKFKEVVSRSLGSLRARLAARLADAPPAPSRYAQIASMFAKSNPGASPADWIRLVSTVSQAAFSAGYVLGVTRMSPRPALPESTSAVERAIMEGAPMQALAAPVRDDMRKPMSEEQIAALKAFHGGTRAQVEALKVR